MPHFGKQYPYELITLLWKPNNRSCLQTHAVLRATRLRHHWHTFQQSALQSPATIPKTSRGNFRPDVFHFTYSPARAVPGARFAEALGLCVYVSLVKVFGPSGRAAAIAGARQHNLVRLSDATIDEKSATRPLPVSPV